MKLITSPPPFSCDRGRNKKVIVSLLPSLVSSLLLLENLHVSLSLGINGHRKVFGPQLSDPAVSRFFGSPTSHGAPFAVSLLVRFFDASQGRDLVFSGFSVFSAPASGHARDVLPSREILPNSLAASGGTVLSLLVAFF